MQSLNRLIKRLWAPILGIPIGCALAFWLLTRTQEWATLYQIKPIVVFCGLNALGLVAIYLGIKAKNWASRHYLDRANATLKAVIKPPPNVNTIAQNKLPLRKYSDSTPASIQKPPYPSQAPNTMAIPKGNSSHPRSLNKASSNICLFLLKLFYKKGVA